MLGAKMQGDTGRYWSTY